MSISALSESWKAAMSNNIVDKPLNLAGKTYNSRLIIGSGKYRDFQENLIALEKKPLGQNLLKKLLIQSL